MPLEVCPACYPKASVVCRRGATGSMWDWQCPTCEENWNDAELAIDESTRVPLPEGLGVEPEPEPEGLTIDDRKRLAALLWRVVSDLEATSANVPLAVGGVEAAAVSAELRALGLPSPFVRETKGAR